MFISDETLGASFRRLRQTRPVGKRGLERTSALMYFLAFDMLVKAGKHSVPLDLDPETDEGSYNRRMFAFNFSELVSVGTEPLAQIANLGEIQIGTIEPEKKASSNFLTVPLKKAAEVKTTLDYPRRPVPLLRLGKNGHGPLWGMTYHPAWRENFGHFLLDTHSKTPFFDVALVVLRTHDFGAAPESSMVPIRDALSFRFSEDVVEKWMKSIDFERMRGEFPRIDFQATRSVALKDPTLRSQDSSEEGPDPELLRARISYLESLLVENGVEFDEEEE